MPEQHPKSQVPERQRESMEAESTGHSKVAVDATHKRDKSWRS